MNSTVMDSPDALRAHLVDQLVAEGRLSPGRVEQAMRTVPRHAFLPAATMEKAYANRAVTIKPGPVGGRPLSCASQPSVVAMMLEQLDPQPDDHVLEVGAGTGYNAALLAELVDDQGTVTTLDIDPDVTAHAQAALAAAGYDRVRVVTRDGALGASEHAPFQRLVVTVGPWDIPPAWFEQLAPGGRMVVPLRWRGQSRSIAFTREHNRLRSTSVTLCGFISMIGDDGERHGTIDADGHVSLYWDADQTIDPVTLSGILTRPKTETWSGVSLGAGEPLDGIWLRLTANEPGTCRITAEREAVDAGLCTPAIPARSPALVDGASLAYLTLRHRDDAETRWELGATGHGTDGAMLAERLCTQIRSWNLDRTAQPTITAYPAGTPDHDLAPGTVTDKHQIRLTVCYG
ncbi:hypothetical protein GCM10012275_43450 [Longimycelium tulufanense]|uniref:Protein-L-isoaspartate O-methyltransferase n=1 Tax=Longimycelium tulufanense TaxID=907463 RepID=A0A8J3CHI2_9PSEU|nr:methyltransferase, FxLD system [Longimycelium tulufanense]GGM68249.1 hypothetical protein GCM10012275_43450 [Longimycelium tulufanense]